MLCSRMKSSSTSNLACLSSFPDLCFLWPSCLRFLCFLNIKNIFRLHLQNLLLYSSDITIFFLKLFFLNPMASTSAKKAPWCKASISCSDCLSLSLTSLLFFICWDPSADSPDSLRALFSCCFFARSIRKFSIFTNLSLFSLSSLSWASDRVENSVLSSPSPFQLHQERGPASFHGLSLLEDFNLVRAKLFYEHLQLINLSCRQSDKILNEQLLISKLSCRLSNLLSLIRKDLIILLNSSNFFHHLI